MDLHWKWLNVSPRFYSIILCMGIRCASTNCFVIGESLKLGGGSLT